MGEGKARVGHFGEEDEGVRKVWISTSPLFMFAYDVEDIRATPT